MKQRLAEIRARLEDVTRAPWHDIDGGGDISNAPAHVVARADGGTLFFICDMQGDLGEPPEGWEGTSTGPGGCPVANARFIAHARQDVPWLLDLVSELSNSEWNADMEAAPRDGSLCWLTDGRRVYACRWREDVHGRSGWFDGRDFAHFRTFKPLAWRRYNEPRAPGWELERGEP